MVNRRRIYKKKSRIKKLFKRIIICSILMICIVSIINLRLKNNHIDIGELNTEIYINTADEVSKGKRQINWKYLAAIDGVRYKNDFSKTNKLEIEKLASMFVAKDRTSSNVKNNYKLVNLEEVLNKMQFKKEEKEEIHSYLKDLEGIGMLKIRLKDDSKYRKFINEIKPQAVEIYNKYGIFPSITISQAILESGWGKSELSVKANNLFGIKADSSWKGKKINMETSEYYDEKIKDYFRVYRSKGESLKDYGEFLYNNKRYREKGVFDATYYIEQAQAIEQAGYSTKENKNGDKVYSDLLINLIKQHNLQLIDSEVQMEYSNGML